MAKSSEFKKCLRPFLSLFVCTLSSLFMTSSNALVKHLSSVNPVTITCLRFLFYWLLSQPFGLIQIQKDNDPILPKGNTKWFLFIRAILAATNNLIKNFALQVIQRLIIIFEWVQLLFSLREDVSS